MKKKAPKQNPKTKNFYYEESLSEENDEDSDIDDQITLRKSDKQTENSSYIPISEAIKTKKITKNKNSQSLFEKSMNTMQKRAESMWARYSDSDDDLSVFDEQFENKKSKNATPLSQRFYESTKKRNTFILQERQKKNQLKEEELTFTPAKFTKKGQWKERCVHKFRDREEKKYIKEKAVKTSINPHSKEIIRNISDIQKKDFRIRQSHPITQKAIEAKQEADEREAHLRSKSQSISKQRLNELSKPRKQVVIDSNSSTQQPQSTSKFTDETLERMIHSFIDKAAKLNEMRIEKEKEEMSLPSYHMNKRSRELTSSMGYRDMFAESIKMRDQRHEEIRQKQEYEMAQEMRECTFHPDISNSKWYREPVIPSQRQRKSLY